MVRRLYEVPISIKFPCRPRHRPLLFILYHLYLNQCSNVTTSVVEHAHVSVLLTDAFHGLLLGVLEQALTLLIVECRDLLSLCHLVQ